MSKQKVVAGVKQTGADKVSRIPVKVAKTEVMQRKPEWIRAKAPTHPNVKRLKKVLREQKLFTVCEEPLAQIWVSVLGMVRLPL